MAWHGGKSHGGQRKKPVILLTLVFILAAICVALGMSLYGAKIAHNRLWQRLQEQGMRYGSFTAQFFSLSLFLCTAHQLTLG